MTTGAGVPQILLVEDNPGDIRLVSDALAEAGAPGILSVVRDGLEAHEFLRREGKFRQAPRPDLVLLDLNLPARHGREVLAEIKSDPDLKRIPVVVLTSSDAPLDIVSSYDLHANAYIVKPFRLERFMETMKMVITFWTTVVRLPPVEAGKG